MDDLSKLSTSLGGARGGGRSGRIDRPDRCDRADRGPRRPRRQAPPRRARERGRLVGLHRDEPAGRPAAPRSGPRTRHRPAALDGVRHRHRLAPSAAGDVPAPDHRHADAEWVDAIRRPRRRRGPGRHARPRWPVGRAAWWRRRRFDGQHRVPGPAARIWMTCSRASAATESRADPASTGGSASGSSVDDPAVAQDDDPVGESMSVGSCVATRAVTLSLRTTKLRRVMIERPVADRAHRSARRRAAGPAGWPGPGRSPPAAARRPTARAADAGRARPRPTSSSSTATRSSRSAGAASTSRSGTSTFSAADRIDSSRTPGR